MADLNAGVTFWGEMGVEPSDRIGGRLRLGAVTPAGLRREHQDCGAVPYYGPLPPVEMMRDQCVILAHYAEMDDNANSTRAAGERAQQRARSHGSRSPGPPRPSTTTATQLQPGAAVARGSIPLPGSRVLAMRTCWASQQSLWRGVGLGSANANPLRKPKVDGDRALKVRLNRSNLDPTPCGRHRLAGWGSRSERWQGERALCTPRILPWKGGTSSRPARPSPILGGCLPCCSVHCGPAGCRGFVLSGTGSLQDGRGTHRPV